jgi:ribosomal protein L7Ae-like RNA K-turn-binding protein
VSEDKTYLVALFDSVSHVIKAEKILKEANIPYKIVPVPKSISSDCGVCVRFFPEQKETILEALRSHVHVSEIHELLR